MTQIFANFNRLFLRLCTLTLSQTTMSFQNEDAILASDSEDCVAAKPGPSKPPSGIHSEDSDYNKLTETQEEIVKEWKKYSADLIVYCEDLLTKGIPISEDRTPPKKPTTSLETIIEEERRQERRKKKKLLGKDLHQYLKGSMKDVLHRTVGDFNPPSVELNNLHSIIPQLQDKLKLLNNENSKTLEAAIDFGHLLEIAFQKHQDEKISGNTDRTWKKWLADNLKIEDSYVRRLRTISSILYNFPKFKSLTLSVSEIYTRRNEIDRMLKNPEIAEFWK